MPSTGGPAPTADTRVSLKPYLPTCARQRAAQRQGSARCGRAARLEACRAATAFRQGLSEYAPPPGPAPSLARDLVQGGPRPAATRSRACSAHLAP